MASVCTFTHEPPNKTSLWRLCLLLTCLSLIPACGMIDYTIHTENFLSDDSDDDTMPAKKKNPEIGTVYFRYGDDAEPYPVHFNRVKHGYAFQASLFEDADGSHANIVASRTKDLKYFVGVEARYAF